MDSIILEVFDLYILEVWFAAPQVWMHRFQPDMLHYTLQEFGLYFLVLLPWVPFQFLMLKKCHRRWLRWLPVILSVFALAAAEILYAVLTGWDALLGHILAFTALYWLLGAALGALLWRLKSRRGAHKT